jgi:hypothetical protein
VAVGNAAPGRRPSARAHGLPRKWGIDGPISTESVNNFAILWIRQDRQRRLVR